MPAGRPTKYKPDEICHQARTACLMGASDKQLASLFDVSLEDLANWAWECEAFYDAITPSKQDREAWDRKWKDRSAKRSERMKAKRATPSFKIQTAMRSRMWAALKGRSKGRKLSLLPYSIEELMAHLEVGFEEGMSWGNYGKWHVDHIIPCARFDHSNGAEFLECWSLKNLQPLWASDNIKKGARYGGA